jgi:oligosaccharide repeat unit polymerase
MNLCPTTERAPSSRRAALLPKSGAALEILAYLSVVSAAALSFVLGALTSNQAAMIALCLLLALIWLSWKRFDGGRHPCFFFLCTLTLFQAGRMIARATGGAADIFQITVLTQHPFDLSREAAGLTLLSLTLSAICIYIPCRWNYRPFSRTPALSSARFLPYLYLLFAASVPVLLYKNYRYYEYVRDHGGYLALFLDRRGVAASIPFAARLIAAVSLPSFVGIAVLETRSRFLRLVIGTYFLIAAPILLTGARGAIFSLILSLAYLARVKTGKRTHFYRVGLLAAGLILAGSLLGTLRGAGVESQAIAGPSRFLEDQGASLNVTEVAIAYRSHFAPHTASYLVGELKLAFTAFDQSNYVLGSHLADDISIFLNPAAYQIGQGSGSSYLAEAYVAGGLLGVVVFSAGLGGLLHIMHRWSQSPPGLFLVVLILPDILLMPRGDLLVGLSVAAKAVLFVLLLLLGWQAYRTIGMLIATLTATTVVAPAFGKTIPSPTAGRVTAGHVNL